MPSGQPEITRLQISDLSDLLQAREMLIQAHHIEQREATRYRLPKNSNCVLVVIENSMTRYYETFPIDVSSTGIALLFGKYLGEGGKVNMILRSAGKKGQTISGKVVRCELCSGRVHELGLEFDEPVDVNNFVEFAEGNKHTLDGPLIAKLAGSLAERAKQEELVEDDLLSEMRALIAAFGPALGSDDVGPATQAA